MFKARRFNQFSKSEKQLGFPKLFIACSKIKNIINFVKYLYSTKTNKRNRHRIGIVVHHTYKIVNIHSF